MRLCLFIVGEIVFNWLKRNYHYEMTRADFFNRFKNHVDISGKNYVAYSDATLVEVLSTAILYHDDIQFWNTEHAQN